MKDVVSWRGPTTTASSRSAVLGSPDDLAASRAEAVDRATSTGGDRGVYLGARTSA